jgi:hypothetical protein
MVRGPSPRRSGAPTKADRQRLHLPPECVAGSMDDGSPYGASDAPSDRALWINNVYHSARVQHIVIAHPYGIAKQICGLVPGKASHRIAKILILRYYISTKNNYTNINTNDLNCLRSRCILCRDLKLDLVAIHATRLPFCGNSRFSCAKRSMRLAFGSTCFAAPLAQDEMIAHGFRARRLG